MSEATHVVKHGGKRTSEGFDPKKLHASIMAACLSVHTPEGQAESLAKRIIDEVNEWLENKPEVTSNDIRRIASSRLKKYHHQAAYLYEQHRLIM